MADKGAALFMCPHCGAFVSEKADKCPNCGMALDKPEEEKSDLKLDELIKEPLPDVPREEEPEVAPEAKPPEPAVQIFLCSECGAFTSENEKTCPNCGASLIGEPEVEAEKAVTPEVQKELEQKEKIFEMLVTKAKEEEELKKEDDLLADKLKEISKPEDVMSFVDAIKEKEPEKKEGKVILDKETLEKPVSSEPAEKVEELELALDSIIVDEKKKTDVLESLETRLKAEPEPKTELEYGDFVLCVECGAFVLPSQKKCGICGAELTAEKLVKTETLEKPAEDRGAREGAAQKTLRKLLGILDSSDIKPVEDFASGGKLNMCTICGAFLAEGAEKCTICGTMMEDMPEFVAAPAEAEHKEIRLAVCPGCGAFLNEGAKRCNVCNRNFPDGLTLEKIEPEKVMEMAGEDKAEEVLRRALGVIELKDTAPSEPAYQEGAIDLCPDCGAFVSPTAIKCGICGSSLVEDGDIEADLEILDLESSIEDLASIECPNCGSKVSVGSSDCPLCGLAFETGKAVAEDLEKLVEPEKKEGEDISGLLAKDFPIIPEGAERKEEPGGEKLEDLTLETDKDMDALMGMLVPGEEAPKEEARAPGEPVPEEDVQKVIDTLAVLEEVPKEEEKKQPDIKPEQDIQDIVDMLVPLEAMEQGAVPDESAPGTIPAEAPVPEAEPEVIGEAFGAVEGPRLEEIPLEAKPESLAWDEDRITTIARDEEKTLEIPSAEGRAPEMAELATEEEPIWELPSASDIREGIVYREPEQVRPSTNWEYGVYASVAAVLLFSFFYVLAPGEYSLSLVLLFGILCMAGVYLAATEKGTFVKSDVKKSFIFLAGCFVVAFILFHWPAGVLTGSQPGLDRTLLSVGILLVGVGIIWMRSSIRYVLTWYSGTIFLFLSSLAYAQGDWGEDALSSALLVAGTGAGLVFASLGFLTYERAIKTSIETDIVRGDADYLKKDFNKALAAYESALTKVQSRQIESMAAQQVQYDVPWYSKGSALILMGKLEEGIKCLEMALAINPNNEVAWVNKGNAHSKLGDQKSALECYKKAVELNPSYEIAWNNLGNVLARQRRFMDALKCYNMAIKINPRYEDVWINKCYVLVRMGKRDQALQCINRARIRPVHKAHGTSPEARMPLVLV